MTRLCQLFAMDLLCRNVGEFMLDNYLSSEQARWAHSARKELLAAVRPCAVLLVDAIGCEDTELNSAIGRSDGKVCFVCVSWDNPHLQGPSREPVHHRHPTHQVYETLLDWAKRDPMNSSPVVRGFESHYGRLLKLGQERLKAKTGVSVADIEGVVQNLPQPTVQGSARPLSRL